ncbi:hypothetical protein PGTUg99_018412 [Puccinia graminis f. sp. tritici]|uniref:Uncharacterized protein n=1 Tax=Puccinia graminis f. sp. tritici TaxID=56615 RepID=A0A5B0PFN0_PUCGR|nr:hypothetical protein PGTUg99_018412 [Puccinia graminis f. sp. tritici]
MITLHFQFLPIPPFPHLESFIHPFSTYFFAHLATLLPSFVRLNDSHHTPPLATLPDHSRCDPPPSYPQAFGRTIRTLPPTASYPTRSLSPPPPTRHLATLKRSVERYAPPPTASYPTRSLSPPPRKLPLATLPIQATLPPH